MMKIFTMTLIAGIGLLSMCVPAATVNKPSEVVPLYGREEPVAQTRTVRPSTPTARPSVSAPVVKTGQRLAVPLYEKEESESEYQTIPVVITQPVAPAKVYILSNPQVETVWVDRSKIETNNPPTYTEVIKLVPEMPTGSRLAVVPVPAPPPFAPVPGGYATQSLSGLYRVQIGAFYDLAIAEQWRARAQLQFYGGSTVDHIPPWYKVRVGGCASRAEAEAVRQQAIGMGYYDAFVVGQ